MKIIVIGAGPAGIAAACTAAEEGHEVYLLEKNEKIGKKLFITGKGRCNVTHEGDVEDFIENTVNNPYFLYSSLYGFDNDDLREKLAAFGTETVVERGNRVFPRSGKSSDVNKALEKWIKDTGVRLCLHCEVQTIQKDKRFVVVTTKGVFEGDRVIIATGGLSYPSTGSTGDGYRFAERFGHRITDLRPSLVPFYLSSPYPEWAGVTLKNVSLRIDQGQRKDEEFGDMLFTHQGISGPIVLTLSARNDISWSGTTLYLDFKPALSEEVLDKRILRDFRKYSNKEIKNGLQDLLIKVCIPFVLKEAKIEETKPVHQISKKERASLLKAMKSFPLRVNGLGRFEEAIITKGGIDVDEINPSTMESLLMPGMYFAGEIIDVDAYTGGYNLQIAFSTGVLAGRNVGG